MSRLRLGIRAKLVATLVLAALLPLVLSLTVLVLAVFRARATSVGQSLHAAARQEASHLATLLSAQGELAYLLTRLPGTSDFLEQANAARPSDPAATAAIEARWAELTPADEPLRSILDNAVAAQWRAVRQHRVRFSEVLITDAAGRLVAATNKASDYDQSDEGWWQAAAASAPGHVRFVDSRWDESAIASGGTSGANVLDLCVPLTQPPSEGQASGALLGVMKVSISTAWLAEQAQAETVLGGFPDRTVQVVREDGTRIGAGDSESTVPDDADGRLVRSVARGDSGWMQLASADRHLVGVAPIEIPNATPESRNALGWSVVVATPRRTALAQQYRLAWIILGTGLIAIATCFLGGLLIARREIIRPILVLRHGVAELGAGNINYRLPTDGTIGPVRGGATPPITGEPPDHVFRDDELGRLAEDFNRMADRLRDLVRQLERAGLLKQQFIDVAGHELRTPVAYILGIADLAGRIGDGRDAAGTAGLLSKVAPKARRLSRIIDNMFRLLKGDSGYGATLQLGMVDVRELIHLAEHDIEPFVRQRNQSLVVEVASDLPPLEADAEKLRDVLGNLLSNAVRFSPDGTTITLRAQMLDANALQITVADQGPGIPDAAMEHLFEPFVPQSHEDLMRHASGEYAHGSRGIGLGLTVVKRFVELHGGTVSVQSGASGTTMTVRLPRHPVAAPPTTHDPAAAI